MTIFKLFLDQTRLSGTIQIFSGGYAALAVFKLPLDQISVKLFLAGILIREHPRDDSVLAIVNFDSA